MHKKESSSILECPRLSYLNAHFTYSWGVYCFAFLGSMLPQYMALCVRSFVRYVLSKKMRVYHSWSQCIPFLIPVYTIRDPRVYHSWSQTSTNQRPRNCLRHTHRESTYCQALLYEQRLQKCWRLLTFTATAKLTPNRKSYQLSKSEIEFDIMGETYAVCGITHVHMCRNADIIRQRRQSI